MTFPSNSSKSKILAVVLAACSLVSACTPQNTDTVEEKAPTKKEASTVAVARVESKVLNREQKLPADLLAYRDVAIFPKVSGFVEAINVDRGSTVRKGEALIKMSAPELGANSKEGTDVASAARDLRTQVKEDRAVVEEHLLAARAKSKASADTYGRLKEASSYPGIIAGNDLEIAQKTAESDAAFVHSLEKKVESLKFQEEVAGHKQEAAAQAARSTKSVESYLNLTAPFDGVISERNVHEGSFVHPPASDQNATPLLRLKQLSVLRLVVPVPEMDLAGIVPGAELKFTVSAFPSESFKGVVRRIADSVDVATRTMAVELDVANPQKRLRPGMFAEVDWPIRRQQATLFVPQTAVVKTTERVFVIRVKNGVAQWVDVKPGVSLDESVEVFGNLNDGDDVVVKATDEVRDGSTLSVRETASK